MRTDMEVEPTDARELVLRVISQHADSLLRTARRHSLCADDAQDAYQRTMEIFVRRAATLDPELAHKWVHTVVCLYFRTPRRGPACSRGSTCARSHSKTHGRSAGS